jgi:hypothetical protein
MDIVTAPRAGVCTLSETMLRPFTQLWFVSDREVSLTEQQIRLVTQFVDQGNGLLIWADNDPYYADANLLAKALMGTEFRGNLLGDKILTPARTLAPGKFVDHALTQGINQLYEGITISTISPTRNLTILAQSHDGQMCMACYEQGQRRIVLDTGFTKLIDGRFHRTAGTARYFRNIAFWLARGARGIEYVPFTPGRERIATIANGSRSEIYDFKLDRPASLSYLLHWEGNGTLGLTVEDPNGRVLYDGTSHKSPVRVNLAASVPGRYICWVRGVSVPGSPLPYVLTLARSDYDPAIQSQAVSVDKGRFRYFKHNKQAGATYRQPWNSGQPGCLIVLLDQSSSMSENFGGVQVGAGKRKADMVATVLNNLLYEMVRANTDGTVIKPRAEIAVVGYEGGTARTALGGALAKSEFVGLSELIQNPLRVDTRIRREVDDAGRIVEVPISFPVWVEPSVGTATPMCAALRRAAELADGWIARNPNSFPPVVVNITDGASTDGDPQPWADILCEMGTTDGRVLLFNCFLTTLNASPIEFPDRANQIPPDSEQLGQLLFAMSSQIPETARRNINNATGRQLPSGARGLILNGDAGSVRLLFVFATVAATQRIEMDR